MNDLTLENGNACGACGEWIPESQKHLCLVEADYLAEICGICGRNTCEESEDVCEEMTLFIRTLADAVAPNLSYDGFDYLIAQLIEIGKIYADYANYALDYYKKATEGEDME